MGSIRFLDMASLDEVLAEAQRDRRGSAMAEVFRRFERLIDKIVWSFTTSEATRDDLRAEAQLALLLAVERHQPGRPGFPRYAELTMRGAALRWLKAWDRRSGVDLERIGERPTPSPVTGWSDGRVADVVELLPVRQQRLLHLRYVDRAELSEIAHLSGVSVPAVSQQLRTVHKTLQFRLAA